MSNGPHLRRITSGASWIPQIDGLRFVAILSVLLFHLLGEAVFRGDRILSLPPGLWLTALGNGDRGVGLFFVISGYILARPFLRQHLLAGPRVTLGKYFRRRLTRLEPPYLISLLLFFVAICYEFPGRFRPLLPHLLASATYTHNLVYGQVSSISFVTWSLEIEVQFYILAPLLGLLYLLRPTALRRALLGLLVVGLGFVSLHASFYLQHTIIGFAGYFLAGFLLADLLEYPRHDGYTLWLWDIVSLAGWPMIFFLPRTAITQNFLPLVIVPLYFAAFRGKASSWFFRQTFVAITGGMCYSIYLLHMLIVPIAFRAVRHIQVGGDVSTLACEMAVLLVIVLLGSTVFYLLVERPCMDPEWPAKLRQKLFSKPRAEEI